MRLVALCFALLLLFSAAVPAFADEAAEEQTPPVASEPPADEPEASDADAESDDEGEAESETDDE